jgi:ketosteroid isomerase-like protein
MAEPHETDEQELLRLMQLMMDSAHVGGATTLNHYIHEDFLLTYSLYEQDKRGFMNKEQVIAKWGSQQPDSGTSIASEQRVHLSGDTAVIFALITDKLRDQTGERTIRTWISDVWVKRNGEWQWFASHESFLK